MQRSHSVIDGRAIGILRITKVRRRRQGDRLAGKIRAGIQDDAGVLIESHVGRLVVARWPRHLAGIRFGVFDVLRL